MLNSLFTSGTQDLKYLQVFAASWCDNLTAGLRGWPSACYGEVSNCWCKERQTLEVPTLGLKENSCNASTEWSSLAGSPGESCLQLIDPADHLSVFWQDCCQLAFEDVKAFLVPLGQISLFWGCLWAALINKMFWLMQGCVLNQVRARTGYLYDYQKDKGWLRIFPTPA